MSEFVETFLYPIQYSLFLCNCFAELDFMATTIRGKLTSSGHCKVLAYPCLTSLGSLVSYTNSAITSHNAASTFMLLSLCLSAVQT